MPADVFYRRLAARGVSFGDGLQTADRFHRADGEALVRLRGPVADPALALDAAMQAFMAALPSSTFVNTSEGVHSPWEAGGFSADDGAGPAVYAHATLDRHDAGARDSFTGSVALLAEDGRVVAKVAAPRGDARRAGPRHADLARRRDGRLDLRRRVAAEAGRCGEPAGGRPLARPRRRGRRGAARGRGAALAGERRDAGPARRGGPARSRGDPRARRSRGRPRRARGRGTSLEPRRRHGRRVVHRAHSRRRAARPRGERAPGAGAGRPRAARAPVDRHAGRGGRRAGRSGAGRGAGAGVGLRSRGRARVPAALGRPRRSRSCLRARSRLRARRGVGRRRRGDRGRAGGDRRRRSGGVARGPSSGAASGARRCAGALEPCASSRARPTSSRAASAASAAASRTGW